MFFNKPNKLSTGEDLYKLERFVNHKYRYLLMNMVDPVEKYWTKYIEDDLAICNICNHLALNEDGPYWQYHGYLHLKKYLPYL